MAKSKSKKQRYLEAVWKLQNQCAKNGVTWGEFLNKLTQLNGGVSTNAATPPPKPPIDPLP